MNAVHRCKIILSSNYRSNLIFRTFLTPIIEAHLR